MAQRHGILVPGQAMPVHQTGRQTGIVSRWIDWLRWKPVHLNWSERTLVGEAVIVILLLLSPVVARITQGRCGVVATSGNSMQYSSPDGSRILVLPLPIGDGDLVTAQTKDGLVVKHLRSGELRSENWNGSNYAKGAFQLMGKAVFIVNFPWYRPTGSLLWQDDQSAQSLNKIMSERALPLEPTKRPIVVAGKRWLQLWEGNAVACEETIFLCAMLEKVLASKDAKLLIENRIYPIHGISNVSSGESTVGRPASLSHGTYRVARIVIDE